MHPSVKCQVPEFIEEYLVYCDCFTDINKHRTCWVLTRNLKFFEFCRKQLVATIDLQSTCLSKLKTELLCYKGPKGRWYETSNLIPPDIETAKDVISLGKYVFHCLNIYKIYVIIKCWDKCVVLRRLPEFKGFEIKGEYEGLLSYRIVHGTIKYCPVLELKFQNEVLNTDFENKLDTGNADLPNTKIEMRNLLERIRCAKAELQLHKSITDQSFYKIQNNLTLGEPSLRSFKPEEKQILGRCGDIWKRFTAYDDLVIGVPLVNQCSFPNLSVIRNITPVLQINSQEENCLQLHYRLFQLKLKFEQLDELETFLESEDTQLQEQIWCANGDLQLLPESFMVILIKLKISQIISLQESPLILHYEVVRHLHAATNTINTTFTMPLQLFLQNIDFQKLLFDDRPHCELHFLPHTLHQDFLTIAMTSEETSLGIIFKNCTDLEYFENFLEKNLDFSKPKLGSNPQSDSNNFKIIFYNKKPSSLWFGSLILRTKEMTDEDDSYECQTTWKIYCQNFDKTLYLIKTFLNDHITLQCNIISISTSDDQRNSECVTKFENALRQELKQLQEIVTDINYNAHSKGRSKQLEKLYQLQMNSDIIASNIMKN